MATITGKPDRIRIHYSPHPDAEIDTDCLTYAGRWAMHHSLAHVRANTSVGLNGAPEQVYSFTPEWSKDYTVTHIATGLKVTSGLTRSEAIDLAKHMARFVPDFPCVFGQPPTAEHMVRIRDAYVAWNGSERQEA